MPWKRTSIMKERKTFLETYREKVLTKEVSFKELCQAFGVSRPTGYKWINRYEESGLNGFEERSRAPHHQHRETPREIQEAIVAMKGRYPKWGAPKILYLLKEEHPGASWPAQSTVGEILRRHGLTIPAKRRQRMPPREGPLSESRRANDIWCADFKGHFKTQDGQRCDPLTIMDAHSRFLIRCQLVNDMGYQTARRQFEAAFQEYGLPNKIRTDNGTPFAGRGIKGISRLSAWWIRLGIEPERIDPGHPEQNGRHERMHRSMKWEAISPPARTRKKQQAALDHFRENYNHKRPHESLQMRSPGSCYEASYRPFPGHLEPIKYDIDLAVRRVQLGGEFYIKGHRIFLGEAFGHEYIGLEARTPEEWKVLFGQYALGIANLREKKVIPL